MAEKNVGIEIGIIPKRSGAQQTKADIHAIREEARRLNADLGISEKGLDKASTKAKGFGSSLIGLKSIIAGLGLAVFAREVLQAGIAMERTRNALRAATGSTELAGRELAFVREEAERLGLALVKSSRDFSQLAAAAKGTILQGQGVRTIFTAVNEASVALGLSADDTSGAVTALTQIIGKGKVSAEELRQQLGERLPGAVQIMAQALGVSTGELDKLLSQGKLGIEALLPFADELRKRFGPGLQDAINGTQARLNRFSNAMFELKVAAAEGIAPALADIAESLTEISRQREVVELFRDLGKAAKTGVDGFLSLRRAARDAWADIKITFIGPLALGIDELRQQQERLSRQLAADQKIEARFPGTKKGDNLARQAEIIRLGRAIVEQQRLLDAMAASAEKAGIAIAGIADAEDDLNKPPPPPPVPDKAIENAKALRDELLLLQDATKRGGEEFEIASLALDLGFLKGKKSVDALKASVRELLREIIRLRKAGAPEEFEGTGGTLDLTGRGGLSEEDRKKALEDIRDIIAQTGGVEQKVLEIRAESAERQRRITEFAIETGKSQRDLNDLLEKEARLRDGLIAQARQEGAVTAEIVRSLARAIGTAFGAVGDRLASIADTALDLVQSVRQFRALADNATRGQRAAAGAGVGGGIGSLTDQIFGGQFGGAFGAIGGAIAGAQDFGFGATFGLSAGLALIGSLIKEGADEGIIRIQQGIDGAVVAITKDEGGLGQRVGQLGREILEEVESILRTFGGELDRIGEFGIKQRGDEFRVFVAGLVKTFASAQEAADFLIREILRRSETVGLAPEVQQALRNARPDDLEGLQRTLNVAQLIADLREADGRLSEVTQQIRNLTREYLDNADAALEAGLSTEQLTNQFIRNTEAARRRILGLESDDPAQRIRDQAAAFNREITDAADNFERRMREIQGQIARAGNQAGVNELLGDLVEGGGFVDRLDIMRGRIEQLAAAGVDVDALNAELADLQRLLDGLPELISQEEIRDAIRRQDETRRQQRELRDQFLEDTRDFGLSDIGRQFLDVSRFVEDAFERIDEAGFRHARALEEQARVEEEAARRREEITQNVLDTIEDFLDLNPSDLHSTMESVREQFRGLRTDLEELRDAGQITGEEFDTLRQQLGDAAFSRQFLIAQDAGRSLMLDALRFLGRTEDAERFQFELTKAELQVRFRQLQLAEQELQLRGQFTEGLAELIGDIAGFTFEDFQAAQNSFVPAVNTFASSVNDFRDLASNLGDDLFRAKEGIADLLLEINRGAFGGLSRAQTVEAALAQFRDIRAAGQAGDVDALARFPEFARTLIDLASTAFGSSQRFQDILGEINASGVDLLDISRVQRGNVVFDERFNRGQQTGNDLLQRILDQLQAQGITLQGIASGRRSAA